MQFYSCKSIIGNLALKGSPSDQYNRLEATMPHEKLPVAQINTLY